MVEPFFQRRPTTVCRADGATSLRRKDMTFGQKLIHDERMKAISETKEQTEARLEQQRRDAGLHVPQRPPVADTKPDSPAKPKNTIFRPTLPEGGSSSPSPDSQPDALPNAQTVGETVEPAPHRPNLPPSQHTIAIAEKRAAAAAKTTDRRTHNNKKKKLTPAKHNPRAVFKPRSQAKGKTNGTDT